MKKNYLFFLMICAAGSSVAQETQKLTVEKIMRDQKWIGVSPSDYRWSEDGKTVYFQWNPKGLEKSRQYKVNLSSRKIEEEADSTAEKYFAPNYIYNQDRSMGVLEKGGDLYLYNAKTKKQQRLTQTMEMESNPRFLHNGDLVFQKSNNLFKLNLKTNQLIQLSNFVNGKSPALKKKLSAQDEWLKNEQTSLFDVFKGNKEAERGGRRLGQNSNGKNPRAIYLDEQFLSNVVISPDEHFISYKLSSPGNSQKTIVPTYVTRSGYTEDIPGRTKVGEEPFSSRSWIYDLQKDTVYRINEAQIPGIKDLPDYLKDYPEQLEARKKKNEDRKVNLSGPFWNEDGSLAVLVARALDNKDLWILKLDPSSGGLSLVDRQRDEAWIGGPGIGAYNVKWLDKNRIYYQSEASGYSHIYLADLSNGAKKQLTSGNWEVQSLQLSADKKTFYFTANKEHPGITHFYKMDVNGGAVQQITSMKGGNEVTLSPDEKWLAINYSYMDKPWELYIQENKTGAKAIQITNSVSEEFKAYKWRQPELISFKNRYGADVYARVYPATNPHPSRPAVVFVHGAGYLQNVHYWWSQYSREYMFNNLLADNGYTVIDIDYTASSGYGRNHRTGIYRHMGGKDLTDQVDGVKYLVEKYHVNPQNVGLYGGSYGGFITLMALLTQPEAFKSGGALRSVTDWAHYNHGYTANILNEPFNDPKAYQQSSPINFAAGLKGNLLMCHGVVDENVQFQDIVRLSQRFIELGKDNWELAVYPVEDHGFKEPSSWTDEYKRIFKLFESTLKSSK